MAWRAAKFFDYAMVVQMDMCELRITVFKGHCDRAACLKHGAPHLGNAVFKPSGKSMSARCGAPVTGLRMGSPEHSTSHSINTRPTRASTSTSITMGLKTGSNTFSIEV
jgi:hypothetical protein